MPSPAPQAPGAVPVLGHVIPFARDPLRFLSTLPVYGDLVRIRVGPFHTAVACTPELTHEMLLNERAFDKGGPMFERLREVLGNSLGMCPHRAHRRQRRLTQPAFHRDRIERYAHAMTEQISAGIAGWQDGQVIDALAAMYGIAGRVAVATMFSSLPPSVNVEEMTDDSVVVNVGAFRQVFMPPSIKKLPVLGNRRHQISRDRLRRSINEIIAHHRKSGEDQGDLLSVLLSSRIPATPGAGCPVAPEDGLSDSEISDQVVGFFISGMETTALVLTWALYLLARHPSVQTAVQAEVDGAVSGPRTSLDDVSRLPLIGRVVAETLRLYPPGWLFTRTVTENTFLGGHRVTVGDTVAYSPYVLQRDPVAYPEPERFDPCRWEGRERIHMPRDSFVPFGAGARKCIGDTFGTIEATLAIAAICSRWQLDLVPGFQVATRTAITLSPKEMPLRITRRG
ncbi:cytochrome P450 [Streptomyces sp. NPDC004126]|uniref:cytochrome P450 n=1 Tax=Streptomyces sp. NPDC004126 TaxID=3390695 RepID=UPI003D092F6E